ncbi:MAG: hypothetical protein DI536_18770 [Archangium gephyra]|uniref:YkgJ family cysteine cluster protein n=1 Tax=Archangium gephyra TaxID=48 RepID=A0A2W5T9Y4_9BACT|nr:MAG: hypothetical protein DI536_18770 [Archangium gephyra]
MLLPISSVPVLKQVDTDIFKLRYFGKCMQCTFCHDSCCQYGCDVNLAERDRILAVKDELKPFVKSPPEMWFKDEVKEDPEYESGKFVRSQTVNGACVFLNPNGRGCGIHSFCLSTGRDYHRIKPSVCWLFPVTWDKGVLRPSYDVNDDLACRHTGPTLYEMSREELQVFFGDDLVKELDVLLATEQVKNAPAGSSTTA